jgi:hypothetical protein
MPTDLRDALQLDDASPADFVIEHSVLISCVVLDGDGGSWVMPYHQLGPSHFKQNAFNLPFGDHVVMVTVQPPETEVLQSILQAVAQWRLALIANGPRFQIQVAVLEG